MGSGRGGHLVVGVNQRGQPTGLLTPEHAAQLDEARLRPRLERFLPPGLEIRVAIHEIETKLVALIHVSPHPDGLVVMKADGAYGKGDNRRVVFREGDIFVRRGTESRRLGQVELRRHLDLLRRQAAAEARAEAIRSIEPLAQKTRRAETVATGAADVLSWELDRETLVSAVTEQLRQGDEIPVRLLLDRAPASASQVLRINPEDKPHDLDTEQANARAQLGGLLDRLVALAGRGLIIQSPQLFDLAIAALDSIYNCTFDEQGYERRDLIIEPAQVWLMVIERIYALGALAVRKEKWNAIVELANHRPSIAYNDRYRAWLRHGHIQAARANLLQDSASERVGASLLKLALDHIANIAELRPDYAIDDERLLSSLTQFDMLANLAVAARHGLSGGVVYPHFRRFYAHRSDPAVVALLEEKGARDTIFPDDDQSLAEALRGLGEMGSGEFFFVNGWDEYEDERIRRFLSAHPRSAVSPSAA